MKSVAVYNNASLHIEHLSTVTTVAHTYIDMQPYVYEAVCKLRFNIVRANG